MKKTITFLCAGLLTFGLSAQNFGVGLDYMMLSGTMVEESEDHEDHAHEGEEHDCADVALLLRRDHLGHRIGHEE